MLIKIFCLFGLAAGRDSTSNAAKRSSCSPNLSSCRCYDNVLDCDEGRFIDFSDFPADSWNTALYEKVTFAGNDLTVLNQPFIRRFRNVEVFNFSSNILTHIDNQSFDMSLRLTTLDLSANMLQSIHSAWFTGLDVTLEHLNLSSNMITQLRSDDLSSLTNLISLDLSFNELKVLRGAPFSGLHFLKQLSLDHCFISDIDQTVFVHLPRLETLHLRDNKISSFPQHNLPRLESLFLDANRFSSLTSNNFHRNTPRLKILSLSQQSNLTVVDQYALRGLMNLESLNFSGSRKLEFFHPLTFGGANKNRWLQVFDVSRTNLTHLPPTLMNWSRVDTVILHSTPWSCDCDMIWLLNFKEKIDPLARCQAPENMKNFPISRLNVKDFGTACSKTAPSPNYWSMPRLLISLTALTILCGISVIVYILFRNKGRFQTAIPAAWTQQSKKRQQPFAYRNLAMLQEEVEKTAADTGHDEDDDDDDIVVRNPIFDSAAASGIV